MSVREVIVVGAGPTGLAAAIALKQLGLDYLVLEKGTLVESIRRFPINMVFFTTPELMEIGGIPLTTPYDKPTRLEALQYYRKITDTFQLQICLREEVLAIERDDEGGEQIFLVETRSNLGVRRFRKARVVVLAMGYYDAPNLLGVHGRGPAARPALLRRAASLLPPARRHRRRQELGVRGGAGALPKRRPAHARASRPGTWRLGEVLGEAGHRKPAARGLDCGAVQHRHRRDPSRPRSWFATARPETSRRFRPTRCCC